MRFKIIWDSELSTTWLPVQIIFSLKIQFSWIPQTNIFYSIISSAGITITLATDGVSEITSPNYPANYNNSVYELWEIAAPADHLVFLHFTDFELEYGFDQLTVSDEVKTTSLTGSALPQDILSHGQYLWLEFTTDSSVTSRGFSLEASAYNTSCKYDQGGGRPWYD